MCSRIDLLSREQGHRCMDMDNHQSFLPCIHHLLVQTNGHTNHYLLDHASKQHSFHHLSKVIHILLWFVHWLVRYGDPNSESLHLMSWRKHLGLLCMFQLRLNWLQRSRPLLGHLRW
jgi:hypothetical protein